jgi:hypothetical protein
LEGRTHDELRSLLRVRVQNTLLDEAADAAGKNPKIVYAPAFAQSRALLTSYKRSIPWIKLNKNDLIHFTTII